MGWNQGYTIFEATVIGTYDLCYQWPELNPRRSQHSPSRRHGRTRMRTVHGKNTINSDVMPSMP
jgi:hypothetical protein